MLDMRTIEDIEYDRLVNEALYFLVINRLSKKYKNFLEGESIFTLDSNEIQMFIMFVKLSEGIEL